VCDRWVVLTITMALAPGCGRLEYALGDRGLDGSVGDGGSLDAAPIDAQLADVRLGDAAPDAGAPLDTRYISPDGDDSFPGTRDQPFHTFSHALAQLAPGSLLIALDGEYGLASGTGYLDADCRATSTACDGAPCPSGEIDRPIVVRAENERQAILRNEPGSDSPPIGVLTCTDWVIEGLTAIGLDDPAGLAASTVSLVLVERVTLRRVLASRHNRYLNTHVFNVDRGASVLIEECEAYDFSAVGYQLWLSSDVTVRRSHASPRGVTDLPGGHTSGFAWANQGIAISGSTRVIVENVVLEGDFGAGLQIQPGDGPAGAGDDNRVLGSVIALGPNAQRAFDVRSECGGASPCIADDSVASRNQIIDCVAIDDAGDGDAAIMARGTEALVVRGFTAHRAPIDIDVVSYNAGLATSSVAVENMLVDGGPYGLSILRQATWSADHVNAFVSGAALAPAGDPRYTNYSFDPPALGGCLVYVPAGSPMRGAGTGGADIGARIVSRYHDGVLGTERLWDATTGSFPCGATVAGINDAASPASCVTVHQRLHVGSSGCAIP
jgi:hypothetical protein